MLTSLLGIRLVLQIGQTIPAPASYDVVTALTRVEVTNDADAGDGFQLTFAMGRDTLQDYSLLNSGVLDPFSRVVIGVLLGPSPEVLINGVITHHQFSPSNDPGKSTLTVTGKDVTAMLDLKEVNNQYKNQSDSTIVNQILAQSQYAQYGLTPPFDVAPAKNTPQDTQRTSRQKETDLKFIQRMAKRNGFIFYIEPRTFGVDGAYWGPETRAGIPQPPLSMNMGSTSNTPAIQFSHDALAPVNTEGKSLDPSTKQINPVSPSSSIRVPPLAKTPTPARRTVLQRETANEDSGLASTSATATVANAPDSVKGDGEVETVRYGYVLRARKPVGVRGTGFSYDGDFYVRRVTHTITFAPNQYTQRFTLSREGTGSLRPALQI